MKPRISPTGTLRAVSGLRTAASALLFLLGVLFAALWLLSAPAQAEAGSDPLGDLGLKRVDEVAGPVTTPVADTLGTVHQRVEQGAGAATAAAIALPEPAVTEVRGEVRGVVTEIDRTREETADQGLVPALVEPVASSRSGTGPAPEESATFSEPDSRDSSKAAGDEGTEVAEDPIVPGPLHPTAADHRAIAPAHGSEPAEALTGDPIDPPEVQVTAGSAISSANTPASAPAAVAGYLATAALPVPDAATALVHARSPHATPADPADDPTVSPD